MTTCLQSKQSCHLCLCDQVRCHGALFWRLLSLLAFGDSCHPVPRVRVRVLSTAPHRWPLNPEPPEEGLRGRHD